MNTHEMLEIKYRPGYCLFCNDPIQESGKKSGHLWCLKTHRDKHDKQLKKTPVRFNDEIFQTADQLENAVRAVIIKEQQRGQEGLKRSQEFSARIDKMVADDMYEKRKSKTGE